MSPRLIESLVYVCGLDQVWPQRPWSLFRRIFRDNKTVGVERYADKHIALVKRTALAAGISADLPEVERELLFSAHSLRAGLAFSAEGRRALRAKHFGHASAEMTRKYQRRHDRCRVNLTKASGL